MQELEGGDLGGDAQGGKGLQVAGTGGTTAHGL